MAIQIKEDYLRSILRTGVLYHLIIDLESPITQVAFRESIDWLNRGELAVEGIFFTAVLVDEETIELAYSLAFPETQRTQAEVVDAVLSSLIGYGPSVDWQRSQGETAELPIVPPHKQVSWLTTLDELFKKLRELFQEKPWLIYLILGGTTLAIVALVIQKIPKLERSKGG